MYNCSNWQENMNQQEAFNIAGFDDGKGVPLDIKKNIPNDNTPIDGKKKASNVGLKVAGYIGLLATIAFAIVSAVVSAWYAIGVAVGALIFLGCIGGSAIHDWTHSNIKTKEQTQLNNFPSPHNIQHQAEPAVALEDGVKNKMAKYNKDDYYQKQDLSHQLNRS